MASSSAARSRSSGTGIGRWRMIGPVSTPSSTKWTVTPVTRTPCSSACSDRVQPGKRGQERRVHVHDPVLETGDERRARAAACSRRARPAPTSSPSSQSPSAASRASRSANSGRREHARRRSPRRPARSRAFAPGLSEATATTSTPSRPWTVSRIAWRFVPVPEASTATLNISRLNNGGARLRPFGLRLTSHAASASETTSFGNRPPVERSDPAAISASTSASRSSARQSPSSPYPGSSS